MKPPAVCHPERPHHAHGKCNQCYRRDQYQADREAVLERQRVRKLADPEHVREIGRRASKKWKDAHPGVATAATHKLKLLRPDYFHQWHLKTRYGLTPDDYQRLLTEQDGRCAICRQIETLRRGNAPLRLSVDHDHATGAIRGLLCDRCNLLLGKVGDSAELLTRAADYLTASARREKRVG